MIDDDIPLQLLLVDDDEVDRMAVRRAIGASGLHVDLAQATDAPEAMRHMSSANVDCLLLDLRLPGMTGLELLRALRATEIDVPVIVLTSHGDEQTAVEIMKAGASDYLNKGSLAPEQLAQTVKHAVRTHRAERETRRAYAALSRYSEQLRMLAKAAGDVNAKLSIPDVTRAIAAHARGIIGARVAVLRTAPLGQPLQTHTVVSCGDGEVSPQEPPTEADVEALADCVLATQADLEAKPGLVDLARRTGMTLPLSGWLAAPLAGRRGERFGVVHVTDKLGGDFSDADEAILAQLAQLGSVAIANALLFAKAEAATRARDDMMAMVSHDLRSPLSTISMGASLLLAQKERGDPANVLQRIQRSATRMDTLLSDLLDVTRIESGLLRVEPTPQSVESLVEEAVDPFRTLAAGKGLSLLSRVEPGLLPVAADRKRMLQVLANLLGNAAKFTGEGGRITVGAVPDGEASVRVYVSDTGKGIAADHLAHLFDRYWQARETASLGSGLGLYIAKGIVEAHGGRIWAESDGSRGSSFFFTLRVIAP